MRAACQLFGMSQLCAMRQARSLATRAPGWRSPLPDSSPAAANRRPRMAVAPAASHSTPPLEVTQWDQHLVNTVQLTGTVGSLDTRALPNTGVPVTVLRMAVRKPQRPQDAQSSAPSEPMWCAAGAPGECKSPASADLPCDAQPRVQVTAFDALAQQVAEHVKKGDQILVSGRLREEYVTVTP